MERINKAFIIALCHVGGFFLLTVIGGISGIRIVYSPDVLIDWTAVSAIGTWVTAIVPIFLVFLTAYISRLMEKERKNIVQTNLHLYETLKSGDTKDSTEEQLLEKIHDCLYIGLACTTEEVSKFIKKDIPTTMYLLSRLENSNQVETIGNSRLWEDERKLWRIKKNRILSENHN